MRSQYKKFMVCDGKHKNYEFANLISSGLGVTAKLCCRFANKTLVRQFSGLCILVHCTQEAGRIPPSLSTLSC